MKKYFLIIFFMSYQCQAGDFFPYSRIGIGYKFNEPDYVVFNNENIYVDFGNNDSALFEVGIEYKNIIFGIKHDSQYSTGWPFNKKEEYYKTELFIAWKFGGKP